MKNMYINSNNSLLRFSKLKKFLYNSFIFIKQKIYL